MERRGVRPHRSARVVLRPGDRRRGQPAGGVQDLDIPIGHPAEFLDFFLREIGILPVWVCPFRASAPGASWTLFPTRADTLYLNFGFWDVVHASQARQPGHFNRLIERKVSELCGVKSLYSDSYFLPEEFWSIYNRTGYDALKARYDPGRRFKDLYEKCVLGQ